MTKRNAFTLVELLVVIAIIGILVSLLLPAVQSAREASRRTKCQNNLKQMGLAFANFESARRGYPPRRFRSAQHGYTGWGLFILPYMENSNLYDQYNLAYDFYDPVNKPVTQTDLDFYICPSAPHNKKTISSGKATAGSANPDKSTVYEVEGIMDYLVPNGMTVPTTGWGLAFTGPTSNACQALQDSWDVEPKYVTRILSEITDGTSNTLLVNETAGWPENWLAGRRIDPDKKPNNRGNWAGWQSLVYYTYSNDGTMNSRTNADSGDLVACAVNCNNQAQIYGFHTQGGNAVLCDGSVHFYTKQMSPLTFCQIVVINDGMAMVDP